MFLCRALVDAIVRRISVTESAQKVQASGADDYSRGAIRILDRRLLEGMSCECYATLVEQSGNGR
jgi:hypothetical protein